MANLLQLGFVLLLLVGVCANAVPVLPLGNVAGVPMSGPDPTNPTKEVTMMDKEARIRRDVMGKIKFGAGVVVGGTVACVVGGCDGNVFKNTYKAAKGTVKVIKKIMD